MSVVIGDDIVPRLSVYSVQLLIEQIWHELRKCQIPKYRVRIPNTNTKKMNMEVKETWIQEEGEFMLRTDCSLNNKVSLFIS